MAIGVLHEAARRGLRVPRRSLDRRLRRHRRDEVDGARADDRRAADRADRRDGRLHAGDPDRAAGTPAAELVLSARYCASVRRPRGAVTGPGTPLSHRPRPQPDPVDAVQRHNQRTARVPERGRARIEDARRFLPERRLRYAQAQQANGTRYCEDRAGSSVGFPTASEAGRAGRHPRRSLSFTP